MNNAVAPHSAWIKTVEYSDLFCNRAGMLNKEWVHINIKNERIHPDCPVITRTVEVGGLTKPQLIQKLQQQSILMNESAERLFADDKF
ncbi:hypothetical protein J2S04_000753 [Alicyclobacillus tengchongensis]|uniref:Uncharacterized protein n=1 Tax=Alicyclobacillus tolerans TaxID=90970 RepID=A0ABT9LU87_9BACL|nr:hypothetical protein [Alicyclobacillus tengchongensis]